jgi:hypothetical protein
MCKNLNFLSHYIDDRISDYNFGTNFYAVNPHLESAFGIRIPDANPGDQNHADADPQHFLWGCKYAFYWRLCAVFSRLPWRALDKCSAWAAPRW